MAKHLTDHDIERIVLLIDAWDRDVKFTWEKLCAKSLSRLGIETTRQTLQRFTRVKDAYEQLKKSLKHGGSKEKPKTVPSLKIAARRIETLEAENARLKRENENLLAQFVVWQYNAYAHGVPINKLNIPLPPKDTRSNPD